MIKIAAVASDYGEVTVLRSRSTGAVLYYQGLCNQSEADTNGVSLAAYIHAMFGLLIQSESRDVLMIGCGGGTLATMLQTADVKVTIVDINAKSFEIARDYFQLPRDVECHVSDGQDFLLSHRHRYDAIVLDAYEDCDIPRHLATPSFFRLVAARLKKTNGCFLANVCASHDVDRGPDLFAHLMKDAWRNIRILDAANDGECNAIVLAGQVTALVQPTLLLPPETKAREVARKLERLDFRRRRGVRTQNSSSDEA